MEIIKEESPFSPGKPVPADYFVGREEELQRMFRAITQVKAGNQENLFIIGERGMGKTSLASFAKKHSEMKNGFIGIHVNLSGINSLTEVCQRIFEKLLKDHYENPHFSKIKSLFKDHIKEVGLFGVTVQLNADEEMLKRLVSEFIPSLRNIYKKVADSKKGIILILDDINDIADSPEFAHFIKRTVDEIATDKPLPLLLVLVGMHEIRDKILKHQPSAGRIFNIIDVKRLTKSESEEFFMKAFNSRKITVTAEAMSTMVFWSSGLPMLMQEVGDCVYWRDTDNIIDQEDAIQGIIIAGRQVGEKLLDRQVIKAIKSEKYKSILKKMAKMDPKIDQIFRKKDIVKELTEAEKKTFDNFIQRMKKLDVVKNGEIRGEYEFSNNLYWAYFMIIADFDT